jgi:hypothetical protein
MQCVDSSLHSRASVEAVSRDSHGRSLALLALLAVSCFADAPRIDGGGSTGSTGTADTADTADTAGTTDTSGTPDTTDTTGNTPGSSTDASVSTTEADTITDTESSTGPSDCDDCPTQFCDELRACARVVFVSEAQLSGAMGGIDLADVLCDQEAERADLHGEFSAWLSDGVVSAQDHTQVQDSLSPFARPDGVRVADDASAFLPGGELLAPIELLATGAPAVPLNDGPCYAITEGYGVWTGPTVPGETCEGWTIGSSTVLGDGVGRFDSTTQWSSACAQDTCNYLARIYCVQRPAP